MKAYPNAEVNPSFFALCLKFFATVKICNWSFSKQPKVKHFTDLLRHAAVKELQLTVMPCKHILDLPSATKLNESGLKFKRIEGKCFLDISLVKKKYCKWLPWFEKNEVRIPGISMTI
ncbi:hypothetical protein ACOSQ2_003744 [Xanthoceras sorbifolium]